MQIGPLQANELIGYALSGGGLLVAAWTRAAVATLRADLIERQEKRCVDCKRELTSRETFNTYVREHQGAHHAG
jgi:hypothetical protein